MKKIFEVKHFKDLITVVIGSIVFGLSFSVFLDPMHICPGGVTGLAMVINEFIGNLGIGTGTIIIILNIPLLISAFVKFGGKFIRLTVLATVLSSLTMDIANSRFIVPYNFKIDDMFLCSVFGGITSGIGLGMVLSAGATTGGTDIVAKLTRLKYPSVKIGSIMLIVDLIIVIISAFVFRDYKIALYCAVYLFISSKFIDLVVYRYETISLVYIISEKHHEISEFIMKELGRGVTYLKGEGAYTGENKEIIMCVLKKSDLKPLSDIIKVNDPSSFLILLQANKVFGEGFITGDWRIYL